MKRKEVLKSLGATKTDSCIHYGKKKRYALHAPAIAVARALALAFVIVV